MLELQPERDLSVGLLGRDDRHGVPEHVGPHLRFEDLFAVGVLAVGVNGGDEIVDVAGRMKAAVASLCGEGGEDSGVVPDELFGDCDDLRDGLDSLPVAAGPGIIALRFPGGERMRRQARRPPANHRAFMTY